MSKMLSLSRAATLWYADCEYERCGENSVYVWEPLNTAAPEDARPYCYGYGQIDFYDASGNRIIDRNVKHINLTGLAPDLLYLDGEAKWFEVASGQCVYRDGRWNSRWMCYSNTRAAMKATAGMHHERPQAGQGGASGP